jgi:hypothetical protein
MVCVGQKKTGVEEKKDLNRNSIDGSEDKSCF